jgi:LPXTG-site transpeptidase (sortase) family protein
MYFNKDDKNIVFMILAILIVSIISLIAVINGVWQIVGPSIKKVSDDFSKVVKVNSLDYNFVVPAKAQSTTPQPQAQPTPQPAPPPQPSSTVDEIDVSKLNLDYNFNVGKKTQTPMQQFSPDFQDDILNDAQTAVENSKGQNDLGKLSIKIPKLKIESEINQGRDYEKLLKQGFWIYPASFEPGHGEFTILCMRRYFGKDDPKSCWYIDELTKNDEIIVNDNDVELKYKVVGVNEFKNDDLPLIYTEPSQEDTIKIVAAHPLNGNSKRIVVLAKRVKE